MCDFTHFFKRQIACTIAIVDLCGLHSEEDIFLHKGESPWMTRRSGGCLPLLGSVALDSTSYVLSGHFQSCRSRAILGRSLYVRVVLCSGPRCWCHRMYVSVFLSVSHTHCCSFCRVASYSLSWGW